MTQADHLRAARAVLWLQWMALNGAAWALGLFLLRRLGVPGRTAVIALAALLVGATQWWLLRAYLRRGRLGWPVATAVGALLGQFASQQLVSALGARLQNVDDSLPAAFLLGGALGVTFGLGVGLLQSLVLRGQLAGAWLWTVVNVVAWGLALAVAALFVLPFEAGGALSGLLAAAGAGLWLSRALVQVNRAR